jgi:hypothetical protein
MDQDNLGYKRLWLSYFDLLGFRDRVKNRSAYDIYNTYNVALAAAKRNSGEAGRDPTKVYYRFFSDTFFFYTKDDSRDAFVNIESISSCFFTEMIMRRIPLRGSMTVGNFYVDEQEGIFFGPALIEAYDCSEEQNWLGFVLTENAEKQMAKYDANGKTVLDIYKEHYYSKYDVPCKNNYTTKVLAFKMNFTGKELSKKVQDYPLLDSVVKMKTNIQRIEPKYKKKYENTEKFIRRNCPTLSPNQ